jgi:4F5 protein related disordered region
VGSLSKSLGALGGNQREKDRLKAQKKAAGNKPKKSGTTLAKRQEA